ncbi:hypothetical protein LSAT2_030692 [Lamellibrachia satsuma]|nr:hypothetical protein LSAT2_030692 [Lamellibrachia satsuma]
MFIMCVLGITGNLFVVAVYIRRMTTSIRACILALGIADTAICVCFTMMYTVRLVNIGSFVFLFVFNTNVIFSTCLLALLATDRCLAAVAKPHKFTLSTRKAKKVIAGIGAVSICCSAIASAARFLDLNSTRLFFVTGIVNVCFVVVIASYSVLAVILLKRLKAARRQVDVVAMTQINAEAVATTSTSTPTSNSTATSKMIFLPTTSRTNDNAVAPSATKPTTAVETQRSTLLVFVVTAIFVVCWLPFFLSNYGLPISKDVKRMYTINSVLNPFIYSFLSPMFRSDVRQFYREIRAKLPTCC